jgi:hypothetical protein
MRDFWQAVLRTLKWFAVKLLAPGVALLIVIGAVILVAMGAKELQIGGLLAKLFGKSDPGKKAIDVANSIPKDRVDSEGNLIPIGKPDSKGITQVQVVPIEEPGLFSNPDTVTYTPPGKTEPVEVKLPDGVHSRDVDSVVVVSPEVTVVVVKDDTGLSTSRIDDLLAKYAP